MQLKIICSKTAGMDGVAVEGLMTASILHAS
jgi:hypothetical protein